MPAEPNTFGDVGDDNMLWCQCEMLQMEIRIFVSIFLGLDSRNIQSYNEQRRVSTEVPFECTEIIRAIEP